MFTLTEPGSLRFLVEPRAKNLSFFGHRSMVMEPERKQDTFAFTPSGKNSIALSFRQNNRIFKTVIAQKDINCKSYEFIMLTCNLRKSCTLIFCPARMQFKTGRNFLVHLSNSMNASGILIKLGEATLS